MSSKATEKAGGHARFALERFCENGVAQDGRKREAGRESRRDDHEGGHSRRLPADIQQTPPPEGCWV